jgi:hypothetical protein
MTKNKNNLLIGALSIACLHVLISFILMFSSTKPLQTFFWFISFLATISILVLIVLELEQLDKKTENTMEPVMVAEVEQGY